MTQFEISKIERTCPYRVVNVAHTTSIIIYNFCGQILRPYRKPTIIKHFNSSPVHCFEGQSLLNRFESLRCEQA